MENEHHESRIKKPLIIFTTYALLNAGFCSLGFMLADGWSHVDSSTYRNFLYLVFFVLWPIIIGISIIHFLSSLITKKIALTALKISLLFGLAGPLFLQILIATSRDPITGMAWIGGIIYYVIFTLGGFVISCIVLWGFSFSAIQKRWKKFIFPLSIALSIIIIPVGIYLSGVICFNHEVRDLRNHFRPVTWSKFYSKYPVTDENTPEYRIMQQALQIMESMPPINAELIIQNAGPLSPDQQAIVAKALEFKALMHQLLNLKPLIWKIQLFLDKEPRALREIQCFDDKYFDHYLSRHDYVKAAIAMDFLQRARILNLNNIDYAIGGGGIDIEKYNVLLNSHEVPKEVLSRWLNELAAEEIELNKARIRVLDINNVQTIVDPITFLPDEFCLHSEPQTLPLWLQFMDSWWRWRNLQLNHQNEIITCPESWPPKRKPLDSCISRGLLATGEVFGTIFKMRTFVSSFVVNQWTDPDEYFFYLAQLRIVRTGIATELYFRKHGCFPKNLEQLCPEFIVEIPGDPYSLKPLQYKIL